MSSSGSQRIEGNALNTPISSAMPLEQGIKELEAKLASADHTGQPFARRVGSIEDEYTLFPQEREKVPGFLGKGSYGVVERYIKRDPNSLPHVPSGPVAVKSIEKKRICRSERAMRHVTTEVALLRQLENPNVIRLYDVVHTDTTVYIILELCEGGALFEFITENKRLQPEVASVILKQLLLTLDYIHGCHVVHRDIKPENILINRETHHIKLIDFGLAKYFGPQGGLCGVHTATTPPVMPSAGGARSPLHASTPCGTDPYLAHESVCSILAGTSSFFSSYSNLQKMDVYGAGVTVYTMLTGRLPYRVREQSHVPTDLEEKKARRLQRLQELKRLMNIGAIYKPLQNNVPLEALECVRELMSNDPADRPSAREAVEMAWLQHVPTPSDGGRLSPKP
eukprot:TRINITY_DN8696_c0_g2_i1.p1 TRINITY_DN8696_c0_g2~~TRINITY_DN8696_c0_g2_i1.p1  ORF type:complete len:396 (+),score=131.24 TRINITY_DN8696_c0_g2_i1:570-1757(+)